MAGGWTGKVLRVNLSDGTWATEELKYEWAKEYIGGRGLATKYLTEEIDPKIDALSPENKMIFATGPLTGTIGAANGRYMVVTKAPLTGTIGSSNSGGHFGTELKCAGYDMIIVEGKSPKPVYLSIYDDHVQIRGATHLWGKLTFDAEDQIQAEFHGDAKVACIGPAGENLVNFASVMNDKGRAAGRSGVGAVMGSKNLKAVAVRGTGGVKVSDREGYRKAALDAYRMIKGHPVTSKGLPAFGTAILVNIINESGLLPTRNFMLDTFDSAEDVSGETLAKTLLKRNKACACCTIGCGRVSRVPDPRYATISEGPEYEAVWALGPDCGINDLGAVVTANHIANEYGFDPITAGATIACAMEMYEKGLIPEKDVDMPLRFGDAKALLAMIEKIGKREGFGDKLALGSKRLAQAYGHPEFSMTVKRQEFPAYDGRVAQGMALEYATSNRGACHVRGYLTSPEILGVPQKLDPLVTEGKAAWVKAFQDLTAAFDSAGVCLFTTFAIGADQLKDMFNAAVGLNYSAEDAVLCGERIWNLERLFNLRAGIAPSEDTLPDRILKDPAVGPHHTVAHLSVMLPEYYSLRGWDSGGVPTEEKLKDLGIA